MIPINNVTICYDDYGDSELPILFIHGFPFDKSTWEPQMEFLKISHRVIAYDIRGFGKSIAGNEKNSISLFADDLVKFMDALAIKKAIVCGLSMGGYILLNAVNRYPEKFEAIILCDTQCIADSPEAKAKRIHTIEKVKNQQPRAESLTPISPCGPTPRSPRSLAANASRHRLGATTSRGTTSTSGKCRPSRSLLPDR